MMTVALIFSAGCLQIWAYLWLLIILQVSSPGVIEIWEALVTLAQFPILVFVAYGQDVRWKLWGYGVSNTVEPIDGEEVTPMVDDYHAAHKHNYSEYRRQGAKALAGGMLFLCFAFSSKCKWECALLAMSCQDLRP